MVRKIKYSAGDIVSKAFELVRESGWSGLSTKAVAKEIGCSTMPIYSQFKNLKDLEHAVMEKSWDLLMQYEAREHTGDVWIDQAIGYVFFARDEHQLFRSMYDGRHPEKQRELLSINWEYLCRNLHDYSPFKGVEEEKLSQIRFSRVMMTHGLASMVNIGWSPQIQEDKIIIEKITSGSRALLKGLDL